MWEWGRGGAKGPAQAAAAPAAGMRWQLSFARCKGFQQQEVLQLYHAHPFSCAARLLAATVAKSAGKTSQGGEVWPPGQPTDVKHGRLVFNTNVQGTMFNTAAGKAILTNFMQLLRSNTAAVFPPRNFGRMGLEPGYGLRLVNDPAYPCTCESAFGFRGWCVAAVRQGGWLTMAGRPAWQA